MLYQEFNISTHAEAASHVADFAAALGWTVDDVEPIEGFTAGKSLVAPVTSFTPDPTVWHIASSDVFISLAGITARAGVLIDDGVVLAHELATQLDAPVSLTTGLRLAPVKVTIFGNDGESSWIAAVVSYEYNLYRHLYMGHIAPIGGFTGGELLSVCQPYDWPGALGDPSAHWHYQDPLHSYFFNARKVSTAENGGLHVVHASAAAEWNKFNSHPNKFSRDSPHQPGIACGGFMDGFNDGYAQRARNPYAGGRILVPQNLYITNASNSFVPVGHAPGIRLVDMLDLRPEQTVSVSDANWKVFPAWRRSVSQEHDLRVGYVGESSHYIGYAYEEDPA
jgi:hypothetical protein